MLICIPTKDGNGMDAHLHEHFGSAGYFTMIDSETKELKVVENNNAHHSHGTCHPMNQLGAYKIDAVICSGMGRRAVEALNAEGIKTMLSSASSVKDVLEEFEKGNIQPIDPAKACRGHGQHVDHFDVDVEPGLGRGAGFGRGMGTSGCRTDGKGNRAGGSGRGRRRR